MNTAHWLRLFTLSAVLVAFPLGAHAQARIGAVDMQRALRDSDAGRRAQSQLRQVYDTRQADLDHRQAALRTQREQLDRQHGTMPEAEFTRQLAAFQEQLVRLQQDFAAYQQDLEHREQEMTRPMLELLRTIVHEVRTRHGFDVVVDASSIIDGVFPATADVTAEVMQIFNTRMAQQNTATPPTTPATGGPTGVRTGIFTGP